MTSYDIIWHHMTSYDMTRHAPVVGNGYDLDTPGSQARRRSCIRRATAEHVPVRVSLSERRGFAARTRTHYKNTAGGRSIERRRLGTTRDTLSMGQARRRSCIRRAATAEHVLVRVSLSERRGFAARTRTHYKNTAGCRVSARPSSAAGVQLVAHHQLTHQLGPMLPGRLA